MDQLIQKETKNILQAGALLLLVLAVLFGVKVVAELKGYTFIGDETPKATITVSGEGEVTASPDIATLSVSVDIEKKTVADAQKEATEKINAIIAFLKESGIDDKDIRTENYSVYPQYDYMEIVCVRYPCPPGKNELRGYQVSQNLSIVIRNLDSVGAVLAGVGERGTTNIYGPNFTIEDEDELQRQARKEAIDDAQTKAKALAKDLGVDLVKIVQFSEGGGYPIYYAKDMAYGMGGGVAESAPAPEVPTGENKIISNISITYEIR